METENIIPSCREKVEQAKIDYNEFIARHPEIINDENLATRYEEIQRLLLS